MSATRKKKYKYKYKYKYLYMYTKSKYVRRHVNVKLSVSRLCVKANLHV